LDTHTEAVDLLSYMLDEIGVEGIEIEDHVPLSENEKKQMYVDILPDPEFDDGSAKVHFYMEPQNCNPEKVMLQVQQIFQEIKEYTNIGKGTVSLSETEDKDWMNNWKTFFKPFRAAENVIIKPTWEDCPKEDYSPDKDIVIDIDPGIAFGTGTHETTKLCIQALSHYGCAGKKILDVGCGSGILAIAALKLGASYAAATDIDPVAVGAAGENMRVNHIPEQNFRLVTGDLIQNAAQDHSYTFHPPGKNIGQPASSAANASDPENKTLREKLGNGYDLVVANILADVIIPLSGVIRPYMKEDALFISSGIIDTKADEVEKALTEHHFHILRKETLGEWVCFICHT
ncbi:MAG: 50S ribosomal protein L11 methyltransferase, partial [Roseburia sp.]|nr:50S ribosomal protein L11 methyltransferase [Roseburia sp.]